MIYVYDEAFPVKERLIILIGDKLICIRIISVIGIYQDLHINIIESGVTGLSE